MSCRRELPQLQELWSELESRGDDVVVLCANVRDEVECTITDAEEACTFAPAINKRSLKLESSREEKHQAAHAAAVAAAEAPAEEFQAASAAFAAPSPALLGRQGGKRSLRFVAGQSGMRHLSPRELRAQARLRERFPDAVDLGAVRRLSRHQAAN